MTGVFFHLLPDATASDLAWAISGNPAWVKVCRWDQVAAAKNAGVKVYMRPYLSGDDNGTESGKAWGEAVLNARNGAPWPDAIGYRNEMTSTDENVTQYQAYREYLRGMGFPGLVVLGSFGVGNPDWPDYARLVACHPDALDLHEYWDRTVAGSARFWALRHIEAMHRGILPPDLPLIIGETGSATIPTPGDPPPGQPKALSIEDGMCRRDGWQSLSAYGCDGPKLTPDEQAANIAAYAAGCAPSVIAAFSFGDGGANPEWAAFHSRGTAVESAIRATWAVAAPPVVAPPPVVPLPPPPFQKGPPMSQPAAGPIFQFDQGYTKDCWVRCIQAFFLRYGYTVDLDTVFQAGKGHARPAGGEAATFAEVKTALNTLTAQLGAHLQLADFDAPGVVMAALHDPDVNNPWTVIAGVAEQDLQGQTQAYGHYMIAYRIDDKGMVYVIDSYAAEDGNTTGKYAWSTFAKSMIDNFDAAIDAIGAKLLAKAA